MRRSCGAYGVGILLAMMVSCSRGEPDQTTTVVPPAPVAPAATAADGYQVSAVTDGGTIAGLVTLSGPIPTLPARQIGKDPQVCGTRPRPSEALIANKAGGLKNAVVIVEGVKSGKPMPPAAQNAQLDQLKCEYTPHVTFAAVNTDISLLNSDPVLHNIQFFEGDESLFNIAQPVQGQVSKHRLEATGFHYVECAVHGWMQGHVVVVDSPYYALTDENGRYSIADLPAGTYRVKIWHEYLGEETREVTVTGKTETALNMDFKDLLARKAPAITSAPAAPAGPAGTAGPAGSAAAADATPANEVVVRMNEVSGTAGTTFRFDPAEIHIKVGTTVRWMNVSGEGGPRHTSTGDPEWQTPQSPVILPEGAEKWRTRFLRNGESATHTFTVPGKYQYMCETHGPYGMVATVIVEP